MAVPGRDDAVLDEGPMGLPTVLLDTPVLSGTELELELTEGVTGLPSVLLEITPVLRDGLGVQAG